MASSWSFLVVAFAVAFACVRSSDAQLSIDFYSRSCPQVYDTVNSVVRSAILKEARMGASLLRLFFHDCFVNGCDGSVLLDGRSNEKFSKANFQSARGFEVIDQIKSAVEKVCPGVVSCADIVAITARDSVLNLGGPYWKVKVGRRDARTASQAMSNSSIPQPTSSLSTLISSFGAQGLSQQDMVALSGAHTIGQARCTNFRGHIYNDSNIDASFARLRKSGCPNKSGNKDSNLAPLDLETPTRFDNSYYNNLVANKGLLHSDQQLFTPGGATTNSLVQSYSSNPDTFVSHFVAAMIKMGDIKPLTGSSGEIRKNCRVPN